VYGTARTIDFNVHQPDWKLASRLMRKYGAPNDDCHGLYTEGFAPTMMNPCPGVLVPLNREPDGFFAGWLTAALWARASLRAAAARFSGGGCTGVLGTRCVLISTPVLRADVIDHQGRRLSARHSPYSVPATRPLCA